MEKKEEIFDREREREKKDQNNKIHFIVQWKDERESRKGRECILDEVGSKLIVEFGNIADYREVRQE